MESDSDAEDEARANSDSDGGADWQVPGAKDAAGAPPPARGAGSQAGRAAARSAFKGRADDLLLGGEDLWDPVEEDREKKRRKREEAKWKRTETLGAGRAVSSTARAPESVTVVLHGLQKAPALNGKMGTMCAGSANHQTGRVSVFLKETGEEKMVRLDNVLEVHTGELGHIKGLEGAKELNGLLCEFGNFDPSAGRYTVILESGEQKRIKPENLEIVRKVNKRQTTITRKELEAFDSKPPFRDAFVSKELPVPSLLKASLLSEASLRESPEEFLRKAAVSGRDVPAKSRIVAISMARFASTELLVGQELDCLRRRLSAVATAFAKLESQREVYFMVPGCVAKAFPCIRDAVTAHYPYYIKICSEIVVMDVPDLFSKAWPRVDVLFAGHCDLPVYIYRGDGSRELELDKETAWLLSNKREMVSLGAPSDGQCLPGAQKAAVKSFSTEFFARASQAEVWVLS